MTELNKDFQNSRYAEATVRPEDFGAKGDGVTDDTAAIQAAIDYVGDGTLHFSSGDYLVSSTLDVSTTTGIVLQGAGRFETRVITTSDIVVFEVNQYVHLTDMTIQQNGTQGEGKAVATTNTTQAAHCTFERLRIVDFKYGFLLRYGLWNSFRDLRLNDCTCGFRFARNDSWEDQTNPITAGAWNVSWFHNQITFENILCDGGEVGIWASCMGTTFDNVTCQNQGTDGSSNSVLPAGEVGTGLWIEGGSSSSRSYNNAILNFYAEGTQRPIYVKDSRKVTIDGWFVQGNIIGSPYDTALQVDNSDVYCRGATGQDYFQYKLRGSNGAEVFGAVAGVTTVAESTLDSTSVWYSKNEEPLKAVDNYYFDKANGIPSQDYDVFAPEDFSTYIVQVTGLHDGSTHRNATYHVTKWNSTALSSVDLATGTETGWTASIVSGNFRIAVSQSLRLQMYITVYKPTEYGSEVVTLT